MTIRDKYSQSEVSINAFSREVSMGSIIWKYLDKRSAAVNVLRDRSSMQFIIEHTSDDIKKIRQRMDGVGSPALDGIPHAHNPQAGEERIVDSLEEIDVLKERYRQALEYMDWFEPAWGQLSEDEQYVLETFYAEDSFQNGAVYTICDHLHIERSTAYNRKNQALKHLTTLLFGK